jgi:hypothetical protein
MNDQFLYSCRPQVRETFAEDLFKQINTPAKGENNMKTQMRTSRLKWQHVLIALVLVLAMIFGLSPKARALAGVVFQEIAGFFVKEQTENPLKEYFDEDGVLEHPDATVVHIPSITVDEILADPPFEFSLPEYIPEGFELEDDRAAVALSKTWLNIPYQGRGIGEINFMAETVTPELSIGVEAAEEISINDQPAMLVRGDWSRDGSHTWDYDLGCSLYWTVGSTNYRIIFDPRKNDVNIDRLLPELIRMAESVH